MLASVNPPEAVVIDVGLAELFPVSEADSFRSADPAGTLATMAPVPWSARVAQGWDGCSLPYMPSDPPLSPLCGLHCNRSSGCHL